MAGQTIDDLLKGHTIRPKATNPEMQARNGWLLDGYTEPFSRKLYVAIMAVALSDTREKISFRDLKAYAIRVLATDGSEDYFKGEEGFGKSKDGFYPDELGTSYLSDQIGTIKGQIAEARLPIAQIEDLMGDNLRTIEKAGGIQLRMMTMSLNDIARVTLHYLKNRNKVPYLAQLPNTTASSMVYYSLIR